MEILIVKYCMKGEFMSIDDGVYYNNLLSIYGKLLTKKHMAVADAYFGFDLSLGEIAEINGISRQSVADALSATKHKLVDYEKKLGFLSLKTSLKCAIAEKDEKKAIEKIKIILGEV